MGHSQQIVQSMNFNMKLSLTIFLLLCSQCSCFTCPSPDGIYPHPGDCSAFFQCSGGISFLQACPAGLKFNPSGSYCDWPQNVDCENSGEKSTNSPTTTTQTATSKLSTTTEHEPTTTSVVD